MDFAPGGQPRADMDQILKVSFMSGYSSTAITRHGVRREGPAFLQAVFACIGDPRGPGRAFVLNFAARAGVVRSEGSQ